MYTFHADSVLYSNREPKAFKADMVTLEESMMECVEVSDTLH